MIIRKYHKKDIEEITNMGLNLHANYKFDLNDFSFCLVCEEDDAIIGFITYSIIYERAEILDIYVSKIHRKEKIGTKLLEKVILECVNKLCENITLEVDINNQVALDFYYSFDFKIVARRKDYYNNGMDDAYVMEKEVEVIV